MVSTNKSENQIIISEAALERLLLFTGKSRKNSTLVNEVLEKLRNKGVKSEVMMITGLNRPVWHLKIDSSNSLYFTIGKGAEGQEVRIFYFGQILKEGSVSLKELSLSSGESPFYDLNQEIQLIDKRKVRSYPSFPFRKIDENKNLSTYLDPKEDDIEKAILEEEDYAYDELFWQPFRQLKQLRPSQELPIRLSPKQRLFMHSERPLLVQGVSGSGKTTILSHFAHQELIKSNNEATILIVAYTEELKGYIWKLLESIQLSDPVDLSKIQVFCWRELCESLAKEANLNPFKWISNDDHLEFRIEAYINKTEYSWFSHMEIREFIRAVLKGNCHDINETLISRQAFLELKETPVDKFIDRKELYDLAEKYQIHLLANGLSDDLDAAIELFKVKENFQKYDYVLVDETHDYTYVQLRLLAALAKTMEGLVFVGDIDQVIYPSHFNWEKVRSAIWHVWDKPAPHELYLDYNYRNPQPVHEIANILLNLRLKKLGLNYSRPARTNQAMTPEPIRIFIEEDYVMRLISDFASNIASFGVISEKKQIIEIAGIRFERTFTPQTVKGLEFNVVCLLNYSDFYKDLTIKGKTRFTPRELFLKFNEVYVSVTRTRGQLLLIDVLPHKDGLWDYDEFKPFYAVIKTKEELIKIVNARFKIQSSESWKETARDFESQREFASAGECWERGGEPGKAALAYEKAGRIEKAVELYKATNDLLSAINLFIKLGNFPQVAELFTLMNDPEQAAEYWIKAGNHHKAAILYQNLALKNGLKQSWEKACTHFELAKEFANAAECYFKLGMAEHAAKCFEKISLFEKAAQCYSSIHDHLSAYGCYEKAGLFTEANREIEIAANYFIKIQKMNMAADCFLRLHKFDQAAQCYKNSNDFLNAAECFKKAGLLREASECSAKHFESVNEFLKAALQWKLSGDLVKAAICYERYGNFSEAEKLYSQLGDHEKAAEMLFNAGKFLAAGKVYQQLQMYQKAADCYIQEGEWKFAAEQFITLGRPEIAVDYYVKCEEWDISAELYLGLKDREQAAACYEKCNQWEKAALLWLKLKNKKRAFECLEKSKDDSFTADIWNKFNQPVKAAESYEKSGNLIKAADIYYSLKEFEKAAHILERVNHFDKVIDCWAKAKRPDQVARIKEIQNDCIFDATTWENTGFYELAARRWEEAGKLKKALECYKKANKSLEVGRLEKLIKDQHTKSKMHNGFILFFFRFWKFTK